MMANQANERARLFSRAVDISAALAEIAHDAHDDTTEQTQDRILAVQNDVDRLAARLTEPVVLAEGLLVDVPEVSNGAPLRHYRVSRAPGVTAGSGGGGVVLSVFLEPAEPEILCERGCGRVATSVIWGSGPLGTLHLCEEHREELERRASEAAPADLPVPGSLEAEPVNLAAPGPPCSASDCDRRDCWRVVIVFTGVRRRIRVWLCSRHATHVIRAGGRAQTWTASLEGYD